MRVFGSGFPRWRVQLGGHPRSSIVWLLQMLPNFLVGFQQQPPEKSRHAGGGTQISDAVLRGKP